jgi:hypothetical protein
MMFDGTNRSFAQELQQVHPAVCIRDDEPPYEVDAHERALQALRDVRHLLPPEGVGIVDAVLDRRH